jgi:ParB family chromosome partitioning protein
LWCALKLADDRFEIIAGERRWRAAQMAGLDTIPAIIREINDDTAIAMALIENIQREDLNPMEQATAMHRFVEEFELTHQQIAEAVGKAAPQ